MLHIWVVRGLIAAAAVALLWLCVSRVLAWHDSHVELPIVKESLAKELACELGTECDKKAVARAAEAEEHAAAQASVSMASVLVREEAALRELAAWRTRMQKARSSDPSCAEWAEQQVRCPL
jgi:hypothetical protein